MLSKEIKGIILELQKVVVDALIVLHGVMLGRAVFVEGLTLFLKMEKCIRF